MRLDIRKARSSFDPLTILHIVIPNQNKQQHKTYLLKNKSSLVYKNELFQPLFSDKCFCPISRIL